MLELLYIPSSINVLVPHPSYSWAPEESLVRGQLVIPILCCDSDVSWCGRTRVGPKPVLDGPARPGRSAARPCPARPGNPGSGPGRPGFLLRHPDVCLFFPHYFFVPPKTRFFPPGAFGARFVVPQKKSSWLYMMLSGLFVFPSIKKMFSKKMFSFSNPKPNSDVLLLTLDRPPTC